MLEQSSKSLKIALLVFFVVALAVLGFVVLNSGSNNQEIATIPPGPGTAVTSSSTPSITMEEAQKQFKAIQDQVTAGTLSPAEAAKQMQALGPKIVPPPLPAGVKK